MRTVHLSSLNDFGEWRSVARRLLLEVVPPAGDTDLQAPGLQTFGVNVDEFADSVFADLQAGAIEVGFGTSNIARNGSRVDLDEIFRHLNP